MTINSNVVKDKNKHFHGEPSPESNRNFISCAEISALLKQNETIEGLNAGIVKPREYFNSTEKCTKKPVMYVEKDHWTTGRLIDELFLELDSIKEIDEKGGLSKRKYQELAKWLIYRIPLHKPVPLFIINLSDLSARVKDELVDLNDEALDNVIIEAISRIFESIDERYFRLSVRRFLKWKISK
ncbi:MAG: hypothetical protein WCA39_18940 [Nitrososphaeraceae archaeon]